MNKLLEETITQTLKKIEQSKDWCKPYEEQVKILTENKELLDQFYKQVKNQEGIQFYLTESNPITVQARCQGQAVATIVITKDKTTISTDLYNDSNKEIYNCDIQLKDNDIKAVETMQFLNYFNQDLTPKGKINEQTHIESMLLAEFGKTTSATKILTGIQPTRYSNLFYEVPIIIDPKEEVRYIKILTRTKVRKLTIIEPMEESQTPEEVLSNATAMGIGLLKILHSNQGQQWYKIFGFHGRCTEHLKIKVCIAVPKNLKAKCKEFEPYELRAGNDSIEYHYMTYDTDGTKITSIKTTLND